MRAYPLAARRASGSRYERIRFPSLESLISSGSARLRVVIVPARQPPIRRLRVRIARRLDHVP